MQIKARRHLTHHEGVEHRAPIGQRLQEITIVKRHGHVAAGATRQIMAGDGNTNQPMLISCIYIIYTSSGMYIT